MSNKQQRNSTHKLCQLPHNKCSPLIRSCSSKPACILDVADVATQDLCLEPVPTDEPLVLQANLRMQQDTIMSVTSQN